MTLDRFIIDKEDTVLLIVDIQDKLAAVMKEKEKVVKNNLHLIELAKMISMPVMVTEQYPKGLGTTVPEIREALAVLPPGREDDLRLLRPARVPGGAEGAQ